MAVKTGKKKGTTAKAPAHALSEEALQTRKRILDAAEQVFARKGFDGARVDEIAEAAGANKALIYYYFESKKALLGELVNRAVREIVAEKQEIFDSRGLEDAVLKGDMSGDLVRRSIEITRRRMPIFGILCVEAFKNDDEKPALFEVMDKYLASMLPLFEKAGFGFAARSLVELRLPAIFFGLAPLLFFFLLKDKWADYYKVDGKSLEEEFSGMFLQVYGAAVRLLLTARAT